MGAKNEIVAQPGERFRIMSPGGGGFGRPTADEETN
jgi:5-oxoprolinase (ATP-hydrolysing)